MNSTFQDESSPEKSYTLPYLYQDFEKFEERFRSLLLMTALEDKWLQRKQKEITEKRSSVSCLNKKVRGRGTAGTTKRTGRKTGGVSEGGPGSHEGWVGLRAPTGT